jgi:hypothetical protein
MKKIEPSGLIEECHEKLFRSQITFFKDNMSSVGLYVGKYVFAILFSSEFSSFLIHLVICLHVLTNLTFKQKINK